MQTTSPVTPLMHLPPGGYRWVSPQGSLPALLSGSSPNGRMTCQRQQGKGMSVRAPHSTTHTRPSTYTYGVEPLQATGLGQPVWKTPAAGQHSTLVIT